MPDLRILALTGSLRARSANRALVEAARALAPEGVEVAPYDLAGLPLYNEDLDHDALRPAPVERLKEAIRDADALLFATPEYNHGIPGVLTTALDWASRPHRRSPLAGKPAGIVGAAAGAVGTARAQEHLRLVLGATGALVAPQPGVLVGRVGEKLDAEGRLADEPTRQRLAAYLHALVAWAQLVSGGREQRPEGAHPSAYAPFF